MVRLTEKLRYGGSQGLDQLPVHIYEHGRQLARSRWQ